jgi:radical SAM protein with 4Fe4S-binding SPASM domain
MRKITVRRVSNMIAVLSGYMLSKMLRQPIVWGNPVSVTIEPTTSCNLRCPECPSGLRSFTRETGMLKQDAFIKIVDAIYTNSFYLIFYFQGEPYLNPDFLEMVRYASSKKMYTATSTNGHYLDDAKAKQTVESGLDRLIISIDGTTQDVYEKYRIGGNLDKVLEGTRKIIHWKKINRSHTPQVVFQFLVVKPNEHQIESAEKLAKEIGVDKIVFKTAQIYDYQNGSELIPENEVYSRYKKKKDGTYDIRNKLLNHCWRLWYSTVITWDGKMLPCCFDKDAHYKLGHLAQNSFSEIWKSSEYMKFRMTVLRGRKEVDICNNCTEGLRVFS